MTIEEYKNNRKLELISQKKQEEINKESCRREEVKKLEQKHFDDLRKVRTIIGDLVDHVDVVSRVGMYPLIRVRGHMDICLRCEADLNPEFMAFRDHPYKCYDNFADALIASEKSWFGKLIEDIKGF